MSPVWGAGAGGGGDSVSQSIAWINYKMQAYINYNKSPRCVELPSCFILCSASVSQSVGQSAVFEWLNEEPSLLCSLPPSLPCVCVCVRVWGEDTFTSRVLQVLLRDVKLGETVSYKRLAEMAGNPRAVRAVGGAMRKNPVSECGWRWLTGASLPLALFWFVAPFKRCTMIWLVLFCC